MAGTPRSALVVLPVMECIRLESPRFESLIAVDLRLMDPMKAATLIGILLIALGIGALAYQGITYTSKEKILDIGPLEATTETEKTISLPPILGALSLVGGIVLVVVGARGSRLVA